MTLTRRVVIAVAAMIVANTHVVVAQQPATADAVLADWRRAVAAFIAAPNPETALEVYMGIHTPDAVLMFPGRPALAGTAQIQPYIQEFCRAYRFELPDLRTDDLVVRGDLAVHRYSGTAVLIPRAAGETMRISRKYVDILSRGGDGRWRVALHIFNANQ
jgi:ketosteroid isomerase-like protein